MIQHNYITIYVFEPKRYEKRTIIYERSESNKILFYNLKTGRLLNRFTSINPPVQYSIKSFKYTGYKIPGFKSVFKTLSATTPYIKKTPLTYYERQDENALID